MQTGNTNSPQDILRSAKSHYAVVLLIIAACTITAYMQTRKMTAHYRSTALLVVDTQQFVESDADASNDVRDLDILTTLVGRISTTPVLSHVIELSPELQEHYKVDLNDPRSINSASKKLGANITAKLRGDSLFIDLTANSGNRDLAYWSAKYVSIGYTNFLRVNSRSKAMGGLIQLERGRELSQKDLEDAQQALISFQTKNKITNLKERKEQLETKNNSDRLVLDNLKLELSRTRNDLEDLESLGYVNAASGKANPDNLTNEQLEVVSLIPSVAKNEDFKSINSLYKTAKTTVRNLEVDLKDRHPLMIDAVRNVDNTRRVLLETISDVPKSLYAQIKYQQQFIEELNQSIENQTSKLFEWEQLYMQQTALEQDLEIGTKLIDNIKDQIQSIEFTSESEGTTIELAEKATEPSTIEPNKTQRIILGVLLGLGLAYGYLYLINMMDQSIKSVEQAEKVLQLPVLAAVPVSEINGKPTGSRLVMIESPNSTCSEAFRSLRVNIESMTRKKSHKVVLFTSSVPSEGKTFTSINYASSLAQQGHRTLLIDMDLRKPAVGPEFKLGDEYVGVSDLLQSEDKLKQFPDLAIYEAAEKLFVLHGGSHISNPSEHISGSAIEELILKARQNFDRIVIDSAPLGPIGDTLSVARLADMLCLVVRSGKTTSKVALRIIDYLHRHGHTPSGIVLNFLRNNKNKGSYYYYYSSDKDKTYSKSGYQKKQVTNSPVDVAASAEDEPVNS